jgi:hypothetical protein
MGIIRDDAMQGKCPVDMVWMPAGYAPLAYGYGSARLPCFFESAKQPHVKEVNGIPTSRRQMVLASLQPLHANPEE